MPQHRNVYLCSRTVKIFLKATKFEIQGKMLSKDVVFWSSKLSMALHQNLSVSSTDQTQTFLTPLGSTWRSPGSTFQDQLWWLGVCSRRASVMEQTTSNNPVIWHSA